jgi:ABC-type transporter Mla MlaB component
MTPKPRTCVAVRKDEALVQPCGALVLTNDPSAVLAEPTVGLRRIVWDLSLVSDIDARGLGALADAARRGHDRGVRVSVRAASAVVHRLAALAKLDKAITGDWHVRRSAASGAERCD